MIGKDILKAYRGNKSHFVVLKNQPFISDTPIGDIEFLKELGLRDKYKVLVGGGPVKQTWADEIGADGYAQDAIEAVKLAKRVLARN